MAGPGTVSYTHLLSKWKESWGISLKAVHVHHQLRGKEADDDEAFVRRLCEGEGIVCQVFHEDVQGIANREKTGLEEAGRLARYRCFTKVCEEAGGGKIALAHHQDDLAETMLHHLVRGTGIAGCLLYTSGFRTFAALWAGHWTNRFFLYDLDARFVRVEFFIERLGTGSDTCQTCHTGTAFFYFQFLHSIVSSALSVMLPRNILNTIIVQQTVRK